MEPNKAIELYASMIPPGQTDREVCPFCGGGRGSERSLSITSYGDGSFAYCCHRASCGKEGYSWSTPTNPAHFTKPKNPPPVFRTGPISTESVSASFLVKLAHCAGFSSASLFDDPEKVIEELTRWEFLSTGKKNEILINLRGIDGEITGFQTRYEYPGAPKVVRSYKSSDLLYGFYGADITNWNRRVWLVEDPLSALAMRCVGGSSAITVCGTNVPIALINKLRHAGMNRALLALDRDASISALEACWKFRGETGYDIIPVLLIKDVKDSSHDDIKALAETYT